MDFGLLVRVPGSSANLGPGFDVLGLALELYLEARLVERKPQTPLVRLAGPHTAGIPTDDSNLVLVAFRKTLERQGRTAPEVGLELHNAIPMARGLGSSGAAVVAGVMLANHGAGLDLSRLQELALAAEIEGHPDNVAASCLGGLAVACPSENGIEALTLPWPEELSQVIAIPELRLDTEEARASLPASYARADAVFNLQRLALLVGAVAAGRVRAGQMGAALADRLHQPYREPLVPGLREALALRVPGLLGVALSGAGPSLIALVGGLPQLTVAALERIYAGLRLRAEVRLVNVDKRGAVVVEKVEAFGT